MSKSSPFSSPLISEILYKILKLGPSFLLSPPIDTVWAFYVWILLSVHDEMYAV